MKKRGREKDFGISERNVFEKSRKRDQVAALSVSEEAKKYLDWR